MTGAARRLLSVACLGALALALASSASRAAEEEKRRQSYTVSEPVYKRINEAIEQLGEERFVEAHATLTALSRRSLNPHEQALVYQIYGFVEHSLENEGKAIEYFQKCLALDALPAAAQINLRFNLAQLYMAEGRFAEATRELEAWFESAESPSGLAYYLLAIAYHQQDRADDALVPARKAVEMSERPRESWLSLLLALYVERDDLRRALPLAKQLVARFPKKSYWLQLVGIYGGLEQDENALAAMQLAYTQGHLTTDTELRRLARMYLFHAIPYRAARVLEKGLEEERIESDAEAWQLLADSWLGASEYERALGPLRRAAGLSEDGLLYVRLGQVYIEREDWEKASSALQNALEKAGLDDPGRVNLLLGVASYNREQLQRASRYFGKAQKSEKSREAATRWLHHLELERQRADRASAS